MPVHQHACRRTIQTAGDRDCAAHDVMSASLALLDMDVRPESEAPSSESGGTGAGTPALPLEMENRIMRERLRRLEGENCALREHNAQLQARLGESRLASVLVAEKEELESDLAEAQTVIRALCSHVEEIKARGDETVAALEYKLGRVLQEQHQKAQHQEAQQQEAQRDEGERDEGEGEDSSINANQIQDQVDRAYQEEQDKEDEEWALFASQNFSADMERFHRSDERSIVRSRAERESWEKDRRIAELEAALAAATTEREAAPATESRNAEAEVEDARNDNKEEQLSARSAVSTAESRRLAHQVTPPLANKALPGGNKNGTASSPVPPIPSEGLVLQTSRAQMA